jgi:hypothetical protein
MSQMQRHANDLNPGMIPSSNGTAALPEGKLVRYGRTLPNGFPAATG